MNAYKRHRFPPDIISYAVWLYYRFNLSNRDIEDLLAGRGIIVTRESIRLWCIKFGAKYARRLKQRHGGFGDTFYIDEVFVKINGKRRYLWRAVDQEGESVRPAQRFLGVHAAVSNLFNLAGRTVRAQLYRDLRISAFSEWSRAVA